jgi:CMP-N-acetylneuraminic acid synthetase
VDRVVVSTDDPEIADIACAGGAEVPFLRPAELASDTSPGIDPVLHVLQQLPDVSDLLLMQPTSPLRRIEDVEAIIAISHKSLSDSVVSVTPSHKHPAWMFSLSSQQLIQPLLDTPDASCRQQLPPAYVLNGALYLSSRAVLEQEKSFLTLNTVGYVMPPERSVDIDTLIDWQFAELLMQYPQ